MVTPSTVVRRAASWLAVALGMVVAPPVVLALDGGSVGRLLLAALWVGVAGYALSTVVRRSRATACRPLLVSLRSTTLSSSLGDERRKNRVESRFDYAF